MSARPATLIQQRCADRELHLAVPGGNVSLAVGLMCPTALDVLDFLRKRLPGSIRWRQRLPVVTKASPSADAEPVSRHQDLFAELGADLARLLRDETFVRDWIKWRRNSVP